MSKKDIVSNLTRTLGKAKFTVKKYSPEILITAGVIGTVASAVLACKATLKVNEVLDESKTTIEKIHVATEKGHNEAGESYSVEDAKKDLTLTYVQTGVKFVKLYGPAVALGTLSLFSIVKSHNILHKRNIALAAAYATVDKGFKEYRGRVIDRFGKELDRELKYNIKAKEIEKTTIDENGKEVTTTETVHVADINEPSDFARYFDESCTNWSRDAEYNLVFIKNQQAQANRLLQRDGYLYLNDVYELLGMQKSKAGQVVGWILDPNNPDSDGYVDFGIYSVYNNEIYDERKRAFVNGLEKSILLDFNVDGNIWELMQ